MLHILMQHIMKKNIERYTEIVLIKYVLYQNHYQPMTNKQKLESNDFIGAIQNRLQVLSKMEHTKLTRGVRAKVEAVIDQEREKLQRHVKFTIKKRKDG